MPGDLRPAAVPPVNIARRIAAVAADHGKRAAIYYPRGRGSGLDPEGYTSITFAELDARTRLYAARLHNCGLRRGQRAVLMVPPGPDFFALTFAVMRLGAAPVLIDPGMGGPRMIRCLATVGAHAFIGIAKAHLLRLLAPRVFSMPIMVRVGRGWVPGAARIDTDLDAPPPPGVPDADTSPADVAAILFTTGSTGPPKGAVYRHENFAAQVDLLAGHFGIRPGEVDLATFPLFALFDAALGVTAVIPDMDPTRPGQADPSRIIEAIRRHGCTTMFGSPALLDRVGRFGQREGVRLGGLERVISAGAAVAPEIMSRFAEMLPADARILTPYGATEALPVACIDHVEVLGETADRTAAGEGVCVGRCVPGVEARIIAISDEPIAALGNATMVPIGEIGEVAVAGPVVTREYVGDAAATALHKLRDGDRIWHRMGDVGWMDEAGRIWFCGRKAHRVETGDHVLFTEPCEAIFNQHPRVRRTALVGVGLRGKQQAVLCVEADEDVSWDDQAGLARELRALGAAHELTRAISIFLFHPRFPVDIRHNAKIFREKLAAWAERRVDPPAADENEP